MGLATEFVKELVDELSMLSKEQSQALQNAAYIKMTTDEGAHYDRRASRINEICELLGRSKPL